jgi:hypothetical protein
MAAAETVCANRKRRLTRVGGRLRISHSRPAIARNARPNPMIGEKIIGRTTLSTIADP